MYETVGDYRVLAILVVLVALAAVGVIVASHFIGPRRHGAVKDSTYEAGVLPVADARRRFNVRFYLVAVLFLVFDVDILLLYPWAVIFPQAQDPAAPATLAANFGELAALGYDQAFFLVSIAIFFALLAVGFIYEWRRGIFRWD